MRPSAALSLALLLGCETVHCSGGPSTAPEPRAQGARSSGQRARLEDGTEVIFADEPTAGPQPSRPGEQRAARERERLVLEPTEPDPHGGQFTLEEAVAGLPLDGQLVAEIATDLGVLFCDLYADRAPRTVANFIGLARGLRAFWDPRAGAWVRRPYYRDLTFHRVIPGFLIQGGDLLGDGTGRVGYQLPDEIHETLRHHDRAGLLCMANEGPGVYGAQFFITDGPAPQLDGGSTIFGHCVPTETVSIIARVPQTGRPDHRPLTPVPITRLLIRRVPGGAAAARPTPPREQPGVTFDRPRGASPGPTEQGPERRRRGDEPRSR
ncbi:MAG: peptidylprolyl isomerase [Myxococcota bacterium]|nr:peptidylprolyl isomerase [Myxococcota bacterium]